MSEIDKLKKFWEELKERNVVKVFIFYCVAGWVILEVTSVVTDILDLPASVSKIVLYSLLIGLPIVIVVSWIYELTSEGFKKTTDVSKGKFNKKTSQVINVATIALLSIAVILLAVDKWVPSDDEGPVLSETDALAIFPFKVLGSEESYSELVPQLMSTALNAIPDINPTDQSILLTELGDTDGGDLAPKEASKIARNVGANRFVLGKILDLNSLLQIEMTTYDIEGNPLGESIIEQGQITINELVFNAAKKLSAEELERKGSDFNSDAIMTAQNILAIAPFIESTQLIQLGQYDQALDKIRESIALDSTFILAYAKYIEIAGWLQMNINSEYRQSEYLPNLYRLQQLSDDMNAGKMGDLVEAKIEFEKSDIRAERNYRRLLDRYGQDSELLMGLAESIFHHRELVAGDVTEAKDFLQRLLEIDSTNNEVLLHLIDIAIIEENVEEATAYLTRLESDGNKDLNREFQLMSIKDTVTDAELLAVANQIDVEEFMFGIKPAMRQIEGIDLIDRMIKLDPILEDYYDFYLKSKFSSSGRHEVLAQAIVEELEEYQPEVESYIMAIDDGYPELRFFAGAEDQIIDAFGYYIKNPGVDLSWDMTCQYIVSKMYLAKGDMASFNRMTNSLLSSFEDDQDTGGGPVADMSRLFYYNLKGFEANYLKEYQESIDYFDSAVSEVRDIDRTLAVDISHARNLFNAENHRMLGDYATAKDIYLNLAKSRVIVSGASTGGATWGFLVYRLAQMFDQLNEAEDAAKYYKTFIFAYVNADDKYQVWVDDAYKRLSVLLNKPESDIRGNLDML